MKNAWKRILAAALAIMMLVSLAACNNAPNNDDQPKETTGNVGDQGGSQATTPADDTVNYDPFGAYDETVSISIGRVLETYADTLAVPDGGTHEDNAFLDEIKNMLNVEITYDLQAASTEDYMRQVSLAITSGELPDIMWINNQSVLQQLIDNDLIMDLTDVYNNYASDAVKEVYESNPYPALDAVTYDGKLMAIPQTGGSISHMIWIRQDWLEALDIKVDEDGNRIISKEELEMVATEFVANDPGKTGNPVGFAVFPNLNMDANTAFSPVNNAWNAFYRYWFEGENGTVYSGSTAPGTKDALAWWNEMYTKGLLDQQYGVTGWDQICEMFAVERLGIVTGEGGCCRWMFKSLYESNPNAEWISYYLDNGTGKVTSVSTNPTGRWIVVSKDCEYPEVAIKLMNIDRAWDDAYDAGEMDENSMIYQYYKAVCHGQFEPLYLASNRADANIKTFYRDVQAYLNGELALEDITSADTLAVIEAVEQYNADKSAMTPSQRTFYDYYRSLAAVEYVEQNNLIEHAAPLFLGTTDTMAEKLADLNKLEEETYVKIITGEEPIDYFDTFVEEYNSRGGEDICEELAERLP